MNDDQVKGRMEQAKGAVKEAAGKLTGSTSTEFKGKAEKVAGKTQATYGDAKEDVKDEMRRDRDLDRDGTV